MLEKPYVETEATPVVRPEEKPLAKPEERAKLFAGRYRTLLVIWVAILWSIVMLTALPVMIKRDPQLSPNRTLFMLFLGACLAAAAASLILKGLLLSRAEQQQNPPLAGQAYILSFALCEASTLFGVVAYFTGASPYYYLLFIPGIACMLLNMPSRERLLTTVYKPAS